MGVLKPIRLSGWIRAMKEDVEITYNWYRKLSIWRFPLRPNPDDNGSIWGETLKM